MSTRKLGKRAFAEAVIERLGQEPETLPAVRYRDGEVIDVRVMPGAAATTAGDGVDRRRGGDAHRRRR